MAKETFTPLDYDYIECQGKEMIRMWGRTESGKQICVIDGASPYFWAIPKAKADISRYIRKIKEIKIVHDGKETEVDAKEETKSFLGERIEAVKVITDSHKNFAALKDEIKKFPETAGKKEHDINIITRYIIDKEMYPLHSYSIEGEELSRAELKENDWDWKIDSVIRIKSVKKAENEFSPKILAFDIEASEFEVGRGQIVMISMVNKSIQKVITWKKFSDSPKEVEFVKDEKELIQRFLEFLEEYRPDFLVGYFSDAFDLPYLRMRADHHHLKFSLGLDNSNIRFVHGALPTSKIAGIVHLDLYKFINNVISPSLQSETISLNDVAKELLGEEKIEIDLSKITKELKSTKGRLEEAELRRFALYNLQDSILTSKLFSKLWPNISELVKLIKEPLFETSRATYSGLVEDNILHNLNKFNEIAESRPAYDEIEKRKRRPKYTGAFVKEPTPSLYKDVAVFDFRSFYPNVIVSFNISMPTLRQKKEGNFETPEFEFEGKKIRYYFDKKKGFIPLILEELLEARKKVKQELKRKKEPVLEARDYALKTLANATYGYFGFFGARYYSLECAASIAAIARHYIHKTIEDIEKAGFQVIYSDTDSVMFALGNKTQNEALQTLKKINDSLPGTMELELEDFYRRGIFVTKRGGEFGAKKKYALLSKTGEIKIRGFESVRRDRCELAKDTQDIVLKRVLEEGNSDSAFAYVKKIVKELNEQKVPINQLVIRTQLKKEIEDYSSIGPHVVVAKRMRELGLPTREGSLIEFVIAKGKAKLVREKARIPDEVKEGDYDIDYYVNHQVLPAVESIFSVFDISVDELKGRPQRCLKDF